MCLDARMRASFVFRLYAEFSDHPFVRRLVMQPVVAGVYGALVGACP